MRSNLPLTAKRRMLLLEKSLFSRQCQLKRKNVNKITKEPIWQDVYLARGNPFTRIEVRFTRESKDRQHAKLLLKSNEMVLLPTYLGRRTFKVKVGEIPTVVDIAWLVTAIAVGLQNKVPIAQATKIHHQNWQGQGLEMLT